jgi:hypothetical protein
MLLDAGIVYVQMDNYYYISTNLLPPFSSSIIYIRMSNQTLTNKEIMPALRYHGYHTGSENAIQKIRSDRYFFVRHKNNAPSSEEKINPERSS